MFAPYCSAKYLLRAAICLALLTLPAFSMTAYALDEVHSYSGSSYFETAAMQARSAYGHSEYAVVVGVGWRDALSGSSLAGSLGDHGCPILMTERESLNDHTRQAMLDLGVSKVVVLGGDISVSDSVLEELRGFGYEVERIAGDNWQATQLAIYDYGVRHDFWSSEYMIVATGDDFRDALSAAPLAYAERIPVFLLNDGRLSLGQMGALLVAAINGSLGTPILLDGSSAISDETADYLQFLSALPTAKMTSDVVRLSGDTWSELNNELALWATGEGLLSWDGVAFASGSGSHDALAAGAVQGLVRSPLLLLSGFEDGAIDSVEKNKEQISVIKFIGGPSAISSELRTEIESRVACQNDVVSHSNSSAKLAIESVYGDYEAYHPKVVSFDSPWNGYKYWMAYTPYPGADDLKENPHIKASNNLIDWVDPAGMANPLDVPEDGAEHLKRYNSDTHLLYNKDLDRLECFWRYVDDVAGRVVIYWSFTYNGFEWAEKSVFIESLDRKQQDYVSPAIVYREGSYSMWSVCNNRVEYRELSAGKWGDPVICQERYADALKTWHIDVVVNEETGGYEMVSVAYPSWDQHNSMSLYYTRSGDGIVWEDYRKILSPSTEADAWDNQGLYRSCLLKVDGLYILYYSGMSSSEKGVGILAGTNIYNLRGADIDFLNDPLAAEKFQLFLENLNDD